MHPCEVAEINCIFPEIQTQFPANFDLLENEIPALNFHGFSCDLPSPQAFPSIQELALQPSSLSGSVSTSDEAEEQQLRIIDERKQRRMVSNRESARRSRMRKQRHLDELWTQTIRLRTENRDLMRNLNHLSDSYDQVLQENGQLKEEASALRQMLATLQVEVPHCTLRYVVEESSN
ncbi:hypothetical protein Nepgr_029396 [Nepenthes gracilis]|uniref:BZIP domain-containing protein n=1 Tax=Nepenthes gracilis TaxID=150966 RepID=A0AAD3Y384_NEPGR|nr:hypothetical protein Nepgr_029396 [Nepenthes gracilis]